VAPATGFHENATGEFVLAPFAGATSCGPAVAHDTMGTVAEPSAEHVPSGEVTNSVTLPEGPAWNCSDAVP
jgi:hypothetical protein